MKIIIEPDPDRYEYIEGFNENCYLDRHTNTLIPECLMTEAIFHASNQFGKESMHFLPPSINDLRPYSQKRREAIAKQIETGVYQTPEEQAKAHAELDEKSPERNIAFLSVDICKSTTLRKQSPVLFDRSWEVFYQELATLVGQYNGAILKFTGDGFIAYMDYPAFTVQADTIVALGLAMLYHLETCVNPTLRENGLIELSIRVGMEFGAAKVSHINIPAIGKSQFDFVSDALNCAVKIQESCGANEIRIGQELRDLLHDRYLRRVDEVSFDSETVGVLGYKVYRMT